MVLFQAEGYMCAGSLFPIIREENSPMKQHSILLWTDENSEPECLFWSILPIWSKLKCLAIHVHKALSHSLHRNIFPWKDFIQKNKVILCKSRKISHLLVPHKTEVEIENQRCFLKHKIAVVNKRAMSFGRMLSPDKHLHIITIIQCFSHHRVHAPALFEHLSTSDVAMERVMKHRALLPEPNVVLCNGLMCPSTPHKAPLSNKACLCSSEKSFWK